MESSKEAEEHRDDPDRAENFRQELAGGGVGRFLSVYEGPPIRFPRALSRSKVDEFVPSTQHVNLRIVRQPKGGRASSQRAL